MNDLVSFTKTINKFGGKNYKKIIELISDLGDDYDKPDLIMRLLDLMPSILAYVGLLHNSAKIEFDNINSAYDNWNNALQSIIKTKLFESNIEAGMTAGQAKPTEKDVASYFVRHYTNSDIGKKWKKKLSVARENLDTIKVMQKFLETKFDALRSIRGSIDTLINANILSPKIGTGKKITMFKLGKD